MGVPPLAAVRLFARERTGLPGSLTWGHIPPSRKGGRGSKTWIGPGMQAPSFHSTSAPWREMLIKVTGRKDLIRRTEVWKGPQAQTKERGYIR